MKTSIKAPKTPGHEFKHRPFLLIGMMRSGSNFLERQLNLLSDTRCHGELFNPAFIGLSHQFKELAGYNRQSTAKRDENEAAFLSAIDEACDRPNMGFRLFLDHSPSITAQLIYNPNVVKIVLTRNLLEAYVSLINAETTGVWLSTEQAEQPPVPVKVQVNKLVNFALRQSLFYNDILTILHRTNQSYLQIDYTEVKNRARLNQIAKMIGSSHQFTEVVEPIKKQNPGPLADRIENYKELQDELKKRMVARWLL